MANEPESWAEQLARVQMMAEDNGETWDLSDNDKAALKAVLTDRARLRAALAQLVGVNTREELQHMEVMMRTIPAPAEDRVASLDAIHALLATMAD
jgi:hypothetical protein